MHGGTIVTVDYTMHSWASKDGIKLNETTLYATIKKAKKFSDIFRSSIERKRKFNERLYELLKDEAKDICDY